MVPVANAESTLPDTFEKQGITIQIGTPRHGHRYPDIHHPNIRYSSGRTYRYYRYGHRPNRRVYRRIYRQYPYGPRPTRRTFRYYRYDHYPQRYNHYPLGHSDSLL